MCRSNYQGSNDAFHKAVIEVDGKLMLIMQVRKQAVLQMFHTVGYGIRQPIPCPNLCTKSSRHNINNALTILGNSLHMAYERPVTEMIDKIQKYQYRYGGEAIRRHCV